MKCGKATTENHLKSTTKLPFKQCKTTQRHNKKRPSTIRNHSKLAPRNGLCVSHLLVGAKESGKCRELAAFRRQVKIKQRLTGTTSFGKIFPFTNRFFKVSFFHPEPYTNNDSGKDVAAAPVVPGQNAGPSGYFPRRLRRPRGFVLAGGFLGEAPGF